MQKRKTQAREEVRRKVPVAYALGLMVQTPWLGLSVYLALGHWRLQRPTHLLQVLY